MRSYQRFYDSSSTEAQISVIGLPSNTDVSGGPSFEHEATSWTPEDPPFATDSGNSYASSIQGELKDSIAELQADWITFQRLVHEWKTQRGASSSISKIVLCQAYQAIIGMGARAVPLILRKLRGEGDNPDQWFWALQAITQEQPVAEKDWGNYRNMARAWLEWGSSLEG